jgi:hypothetical protein
MLLAESPCDKRHKMFIITQIENVKAGIEMTDVIMIYTHCCRCFRGGGTCRLASWGSLLKYGSVNLFLHSYIHRETEPPAYGLGLPKFHRNRFRPTLTCEFSI